MIDRLTAISPDDLRDLVGLLTDAVADGASVGFLAPLPEAAAATHWRSLEPEVTTGSRLLFVARHDGRIVGSVQLALAGQPNAGHRAEVQKLLVHTAARRRGLGARLMAAAERAAAAAGRTLVVLDTRTGDAASRLYERLGYTLAGTIPGYARSSAGRLEGTSIYYRTLAPSPAEAPHSPA